MVNDSEDRVSALADGELDDTEMEAAVDAIGRDPGLAERWHRYHLISDALRNNLSEHFDHRLHERISDALEDEPVVLAPRRRPLRIPPVARQAIGLAMASSVTAIAILGVQSLNGGDNGPGPAIAEGPDRFVFEGEAGGAATWQRPARVPVQTARVPGEAWRAEAPERRVAEPRLSPYLVNHNAYSVSSGMHGMLPYVRVVGQGDGQ